MTPEPPRDIAEKCPDSPWHMEEQFSLSLETVKMSAFQHSHSALSLYTFDQ